MTEKYESGTFCVDIQCPKHRDLESLEGNAYQEKKRTHCKECNAWEFFLWLDKHGYSIVKTLKEISAKELAARLKGIDPVTVESLTVDEILCL